MKTRKIIPTAVCVLSLGIAGCGGQSDQEKTAGESQKASSAQATDRGSDVPKETVEAWPAKFCSLKLGMTRAQVADVMGGPTHSYKDSASNQDTWEGDNVDVTAFYDDDGKVRQLDDSTGESKLPCARTRQ